MRTRTQARDELAGLLGDGEPGTLMTPMGERIPVRVDRRDGDVVLLVLIVGRDEMLEADGLVLECRCQAGIARLRGEAELGHDDLVRFRVSNVIEVLQRRRFFRVATAQRVEVSTDAGPQNTYSVDISGGGMLLTGPQALEPGDRVRFRLYLGADATPIEGHAGVVRTTGDGRRAIAFEEIPRHEEERLIRFLFDRQRAERALTRGDAR